ncbi:protein of unknown function [Hyphomicrobium sp. MC1]|nr:protein of unknown function [Hyphomicrobium sp. MC1]
MSGRIGHQQYLVQGFEDQTFDFEHLYYWPGFPTNRDWARLLISAPLSRLLSRPRGR